MKTNYRLLVTTSLTALLTASNVAVANPIGGDVVAGSATITEVGKKLDIHQTSDRAVIDWRGFDIAPDEHTQFYQPSSSAIAINRVNSTNPSTIAGQLSANGNVILINPNGVFFSKTSTVDVNGMIATTADIDNQKFMGGSLHFDKPGNPNASIINAGSITAKEAGLVGLVAPNVENSGIITARLGRVHLASGDTATIDLYGDGLMEVKASDALTSQLVKNTGTINAAGGTIALTAAAGRATVNSVVKVSGELNAPAVSMKNGKIIIAAEGSNAVTGNLTANKSTKQGSSNVIISAAKLNVSGKNASEKGGTVTITGDDITLKDYSVIDASGAASGGTILIGGEYQGKGTTSTARSVFVEQDVQLLADALTNGNGGNIILWADDAMRFHGSIFARGGAQGGNGGFVETSGHNTLTVANATVNLTDAQGNAGTWLLDPADITIVSNGTASDGVNTFKASDLAALSTSANVILSATNNITFNMGGDTANLASNRNISLTAGNDMLTSSSGIIRTSGTGGITFTADSDMQLNGLQLEATGTGNISLRGIDSLRTDTISMGSGNLTLSTNDNLTIGSQLTGTGELTLLPYTAATKMRIDNGTNADFSLNTTEIGLLQSNWSMIYFGRTDGTLSFVPSSDVTWKNSLTIRNGEETQLGSSIIHMINGASLAFENTTVHLITNIFTDGGDVNFIGNTSSLLGRGGNITTNGGDINVKRFLQILGQGTYDTRGNGTDGNINLTQGIGETYSTSPTGVKLYAGTGTIAFGGAVDGTFGGSALDIEASGGALTFNGAWGLKGANNFPVLRNVTLSSINTNITLPNLAATGNVSLNAGTGTITTGTINTGTGNLSLVSDDININGDLSGTGDLLLRPYGNINMRINWYGGDYNLDTTELNHIKNGWNNITIGHAGGDVITMGDNTWNDNVTIVKNASGFASLQLYGSQTLNDNASLTLTSSYVDLYGNITTDGGAFTVNGATTGYNNGIFSTSGGAVNFNGDVRINASGSPLNVNSGGGNITLANSLYDINGSNAGKTIILNAGAGDISFGNTINTDANVTASAAHLLFNGAWGNSTTLGTVSLTSANSYALPAIKAASLYLNTLATVTQTAAMEATNLLLSGTGGVYTLTNTSNNIGTLAGNTGSVNLKNGSNNLTVGTVNSIAGLTTTGNVLLDADYGVITVGPISTGTGNLTLTSQDIVINGDLSGTGILALRPNAANTGMRVNFYSNDYNLDTAEIAHFVDGWSLIELGRADSANNLNFGGATFHDPVKFLSYFTGVFGNFVGQGNASLTTNDAVEIFDGSTITTQGGGININNGLTLTNGGTTLATVGGNISISGAVTQTGTVGDVILNAGTGSLALGSTLDGAFNLTTTANSYSLGGALGSNTALANVIINSLNTLTLPSITAANILAKTTSAVADIIIGSGKALTTSGSGTAITLASGRSFLNNSGSSTPFAVTGGGRWLVYANNPTANSLYGLVSGFELYNCSYLGACTGLPATGNGLLYSAAQPIVSNPTPVNTPPAVTASTLPSQVLRGINVDPYIPNTRIVSIPISYKSETTSSGDRDERIDTSSTSTRRPNSDNRDISITFSHSLQREFNVQTD